MKAYVYGAGGAAITEAAKPSPKGTQVLVRVRACALNRADLGMSKGHAHGAAGGVGTVLGMEWAGEIAELGPGVEDVKVGDRVMGSGAAAFAEYTLADHGRLFSTPSNMNFEEACTLPIALTTMHNAVVTVGGLRAGQTVMIQGASSGVGLMALQIAKLKGASLVVGSSTDPARRARLKEFGADLAVDSSDPDWVDSVLQATSGEGVDLIVDQVSGKVASQNLKATKIKGRIVNVGRLGGTHADFNFDLHAARRINYIGVTFRTRTIDEIREIFDEVRKDIWAAVESRKLRLPIDKVFTFDDIGKAFEHMEANRHLGKIVVIVWDSRIGLTIRSPAKSFSLSVTTMHPFAPATAAMIMSSALRGRPAAFPSAISRAQIRPAFSSNGRTRPAKSACGPSGPENQVSSASRCLPRGFSRTPLPISARVSEAMNRSSSRRAVIQAISTSDGRGLTMLLMILVSRRKRVTGRSRVPLHGAAQGQERRRRVANGARL
jgi:NADPH:quinone reductase